MIEFNYETDFSLENEQSYKNWIYTSLEVYNAEVGEVNYYFYNDEDLHKINVEHLNHDTLTDIISFDYSVGNIISGDICISVDRVKENANTFSVSFDDELARVMSHGLLHFLGYKDKTENEKEIMRENENIFIKLLKNK